jgi:SAM-dependent methyltransferase
MLNTLKAAVKDIPIIGPVLMRLKGSFAPNFRFRSTAYWENRYRAGGNSGAGSYNRLAEFKARFLNGFVEAKDIGSVIEFGCGDGNQLTLARYPSYVGVDVSNTALAQCRTRFATDHDKQFVHATMADGRRAELALSLDVIFHLVEDHIFEGYMRDLFGAADRYVIVYASNKDEPHSAQHVRHRQFTKWVAAHAPDWLLEQTVPNAHPFDAADPDNTSFADFYVFGRVR